MNISEFINQHYDVVFKSEKIESFDEVEEFLLGELHYSTDRMTHNLFINMYGEESVVFFEGYKLFTVVDHKKLGVNTQKTIAFGWDYILNGKRQRTEPDQLFESEEADQLEDELQEMKLRRSILLEQQTSKHEIENLDQQINQVSEKLKTVNDKIFLNIKNYYDLRAASLNEALVKAPTLNAGSHTRKVFLIAGAAHLRRATKGLEQTKIDQNSFYDFLNKRKVVILFPKGLQTV